ncbi:MAG: hypothetical protein ACL7BU_02845 [Candidatus Phlomobacter fragariae]
MMKWLFLLTMGCLILVGCGNKFPIYTLEEKKALWKKHDSESRKLIICETKYKENPSLLLDCVNSIDDPDFERLINDPDLKP